MPEIPFIVSAVGLDYMFKEIREFIVGVMLKYTPFHDLF